MPSKPVIEYKKTVLENSLRIVTEKIPSARSISIGVWIDVGTRDEQPDENGMSHFTEHMFFKGTRTRSALKIASSLESLGGSLNAFTSREQTCYHALVLDEHIEQAVEIISDILMNSTLTPTNIEREKLVVVEEIREVNDTPADRIHELFADSFWRGQPLGWPIMGTEENVLSFNRRRLKAFMRKHYRAGRIVVAAAGNVYHRRLVSLVKEKLHFAPGVGGRGKQSKDPAGTYIKFYKNNSNQAHVCIGFPGLSFNHPERLRVLVLHTYLGGGMASVLFQKIREEKGMAYTVYTFPDFYRDCGAFGVYLATDRRHLRGATQIILREFEKVKRIRLQKSKLEEIKDQFKGSLLLGMESTSGRMNRLGRQEVLMGKYIFTHEAIREIRKIEPDDLRETARKILNPDNMTITVLGSADKSDLRELIR
jgi:predicted Zn-dependent peptidase